MKALFRYDATKRSLWNIDRIASQFDFHTL